MAEAAVMEPLLRGLPDEIVVWEILVRLHPNALLLSCPAWRRATSSRDFLLAHHARQPTLPLLRAHTRDSLDIIPFAHRTELAADQLQSIARLGPSHFQLAASCDGLLVLSVNFSSFCICNPATRRYAPLMPLHCFRPLGMYRYSLTGEYRLLLGKTTGWEPDDQDGSYVFTLGSSQPPRRIGYPEVEEVIYTSSLLFGGNLHWHIHQDLSKSASNLIMVFDTTVELFWEMHAPAVSGNADLFEMGGMLGMASFNSENTIIGIWVMQDYERENWTFKCRIELPVEELWMQCVNSRILVDVVVMHENGELLVLVEIEDRLHHVDINGKLVASFHRRGILPTQLQLKQTLVRHTFFPTLEGYVVNDSPFI